MLLCRSSQDDREKGMSTSRLRDCRAGPLSYGPPPALVSLSAQCLKDRLTDAERLTISHIGRTERVGGIAAPERTKRVQRRAVLRYGRREPAATGAEGER
jgi:hypothetical protein